MSSDVIIRQSVRQAANTLGWWIFASALVVSLAMPLVSLGVFSVYAQYKIDQAQQAFEDARTKMQQPR
jgi:cytochrome c-type biogenesis protein CcmH/NrfG